MGYCTNCGQEIKDGEEFCGNCGTPCNSQGDKPKKSSSKQGEPFGKGLGFIIVTEVCCFALAAMPCYFLLALPLGQLLLGFTLFLLVFNAVIFAVRLIIDVIQDKGYFPEKTGILWLIGIFATPITLGVYAISLPDKSK